MNASTNTPACVNPEDDVIDRIDELVTESLSKPWDQISGYDNDINQESCGHCGRAWHGLPLGVCPGATFIGPRRPTALEQESINAGCQWPNDNPPPPYEHAEAVALGTIAGAPWQVPDLADVFDPEPWRVFGGTVRRAMEPINESIGVLQVTRWLAPDEPEPPTPQQRALPRPSSTPPMWAHQPNQRRRRNRM